jgi:mono/diheme cytochrome c family protein
MSKLLTLLAFVALTSSLHGEGVDYVRDIQPIFKQHCTNCHGAEKSKASLRVDSIAGMKEGGDGGPALVSGKSKESRLFLALSGGTREISKMPPKGELSSEQIAKVKAWIDAGAPGMDAPNSTPSNVKKSTHWSFQPIQNPPPPSVKTEQWVRNGIDRFILSRLEKEKIAPSPEAEKTTLIRRVYLDLLGLPPTPEQVHRYLQDQRPDAYERMVEEALMSPHYGERWGRHWLDAARYADSNGYSIDAPRSIWKYREWVIDAINRDLPFSQFTIEQLAGDLLPEATTEQRIATGFHRNTMINQEGGINPEQFRVEAIVDRVNTTGSVFLGLTIGCCQCHDHKFDPISQREYYQFFAFFNNSDEPLLELASTSEIQRRNEVQKELREVERTLKIIDPTNEDNIEKWERSLTDETRTHLAKPIAAIFLVAPNGRSAKQKQTLEEAYRGNDSTRHVVGSLLNPFSAVVHTELLKSRQTLVKRQAELKKKEPVTVSTMVVQERKAMRPTNVMLGGDFLRQGVSVQTGTPAVLPELKASGSKTRLDLARWIVSEENPLTARVLVNRIWGIYFGTGIVETENDFGTQGTLPTHPELLDYLASQFMKQNWSMKSLHRLILTSSTYRQSSKNRPDLSNIDARNRLLAKQNRLRLEAEIVRDVALSASGLLNTKIGGPSVFPPQPDGVYRFTQIDKAWKTSSGTDRFRRGMYTHFWRSAPHPALVVFDAPDPSTSCTRRNRSNTPLQALTLLNDSGFHEYAHGLAVRIVTRPESNERENLKYAFELCLARTPTDRELQRLVQFLAAQREAFEEHPSDAKELLSTSELQTRQPTRQAAWVMTARALLNLDEMITRE